MPRPASWRWRSTRSATGTARAEVFADAQHLRQADGSYWTGYVYADQVNWPAEHTTFTTAAALLANDALTETTGGTGFARGTGLVPAPDPIALECGCASVDSVAGRA